MEEEIIVILGPTASGKTALAVELAKEINAEIISADSRQVYKGMDIGTGKDLKEYGEIKYHLIDILDAGEKYNLQKFQEDFALAYKEILGRKKRVILCGGTGLYIQSLIQSFTNTQISEDLEFRKAAEKLNLEEIDKILGEDAIKYDTRKRKIRGIEIERFLKENPNFDLKSETYSFKVFGLNPDVETRRNRISKRLKTRINEGMIQEVEHLIYEGVSYEMLEYYGLEYKYLGNFLQGFIRYDDMLTKLETEIHRYAKRQMTFFRSMEKKGIDITWFTEEISTEEKINLIKKAVNL